MDRYVDGFLIFLLGLAAGGFLLQIPLEKGVSVTDVVSILATIIGIIMARGGIEQWRLDKLVQLHMNLRDEYTCIQEKIDKLKKQTNNKKKIEDLRSSCLSELELIATMVLKKKIDEIWAKDFFETYFHIISDEKWSSIIIKAQKSKDTAYEYLTRLAQKWEIPLAKNPVDNNQE